MADAIPIEAYLTGIPPENADASCRVSRDPRAPQPCCLDRRTDAGRGGILQTGCTTCANLFRFGNSLPIYAPRTARAVRLAQALSLGAMAPCSRVAPFLGAPATNTNQGDVDMKRYFLGTALVAAMPVAAAAQDCGEVSIAEMNWASAQIVLRLTRNALVKHFK